jgi:hypothetical protein
MGAWGTASFENDDALDWLAVLEAEGLQATGGAIQDVLDLSDEYLEAPICSAALAAAEVLAALRGQPAANLPPDVLAWISAHPGDPPSDLVANARAAVDAVLTDSELLELWSDRRTELPGRLALLTFVPDWSS